MHKILVWLAGAVWFALLAVMPVSGRAAEGGSPLVMVTVERPPFAMPGPDGRFTGFSIELMQALADEMARELRIEPVETFADMFDAVIGGRVDGAVANISITAAREKVMDFTQPIFDSGLQIMIPARNDAGSSIFQALFRWEVGAWILGAFAVLLGVGMLMWLFENKWQDYFRRPFREALFPSFWWALNLVVNGGFEERLPHSRLGRLFAVLLVVSSLFIVSVFVSYITAAMTVQAISQSVTDIRDLEGRRVATTIGSTASELLENRNIPHLKLATLDEVLERFESGDVDAVIFDGPILAWYVRNEGAGKARLVDRVFQRENYGIALPQGSALREEMNRALLALRERGDYAEIRAKWFGSES